MKRCQHCGSQVDQGAVYCPHCGGAVTGESSAHDDTHRDRSPGEPGARPRAEHSGDERRQQQDSRHSGPEQPRQESSGVGRRTLLVGGGGLLALGAGGWYLFLRETSPDDPMGVLERSWEVWEEGDFEAYDELVHSDSPMRAEEWWETIATGEEEFGLPDGVEWTLEEREQVEKTDDRAAIREVYIWHNPDPDWTDEEVRGRLTEIVRFRTEDGEWKVWDREQENWEDLTEE